MSRLIAALFFLSLRVLLALVVVMVVVVVVILVLLMPVFVGSRRESRRHVLEAVHRQAEETLIEVVGAAQGQALSPGLPVLPM